MKYLFIKAIQALALLLVAGAFAHAQSPPGWGWVNQLGTYVPNATSQNQVAGLGRDAAGNLYLLGTTANTAPRAGAPAGSAGGSDVFLAKYNPAGGLLWRRTLQSSGDDGASALFVEPSGRCTLAGSYGYLTGDNLSLASFNSTASPLAGAALLGLPTTGGWYQALPFVAAVDANGNLLWANNPSPVYGGVLVQSLHRDGAGNCYVSAYSNPQGQLVVNGQNYPALGSYDAVLLKYSVAGQPVWARRLGAGTGDTFGGEVTTDAANAVYWTVNHDRTLVVDGRSIPAMTPSSPVIRGSDILFKISAANTVLWAKNGLLKAGNTNAQGGVLHLDEGTSTMYLYCGSYGGTITSDANPSIALTVPTNSYGTCVARCDTSGTAQWIRPIAFGSTIPGGVSWAAVGVVNFFPDATGFTSVTNTCYGAQTVYPANNVFISGSNGMPCVSHYNYATGQCDWVRVGGVPANAPSGHGSNVSASVIDAAGNVFVAGTFTGTARFGTTSITSSSTIQPEIFLAKLDQSILTATKPASTAQVWSVFPNPATGSVQLAGLPPVAHVRVFDALGRLVRELLPTPSADAPRVLNGLAPGLYLLQVTHTLIPYRSQRLVVQ